MKITLKMELTHFRPMFYFCTPWKMRKHCFLTFSGGIETEHLAKMGYLYVRILQPPKLNRFLCFVIFSMVSQENSTIILKWHGVFKGGLILWLKLLLSSPKGIVYLVCNCAHQGVRKFCERTKWMIQTFAANLKFAQLTLPVLCIWEIYFKINLNSYFPTSLLSLKPS